MKTLLKRACLIGAISAAIPFAASSQSVRWDMANEYGQTSMLGQSQVVFVDKVKELSDGDIVITSHFGGSIGFKSQEQFDAVADGALQIASTSVGQVAGIEPLFLLGSLPFMANNIEDAWTLYEVARPYYEEVFERNDQLLLYASPWTPAGIWAKKPVTELADLKNLKVRAWDASGTRTLQAAGAVAVQMAWSDVVPQLAAGGIDAVLTSADGGASAKFWEFLDHFTAINYSQSLNMTHVNKDEFEKLTPEQQKIIRDAAAIAEKEAWDNLTRQVEKNYAEMKSHGMTIIDSTSAEFHADLQAAGKGVVADWLKSVGPVGQEILDKYAKARASR